MAAAKPTRIRIDDATRIQLLTLLLEAEASVRSVAIAVEVLANAARLPAELNQIAQHAVASIMDLDDRVKAFLKEEGGNV